MMNYYEVLEISDTASDEVIKAAYKALVKKYHPDNGGNNESSKSMAIINEAYAILSDPIKRHDYDEKLAQATVKSEKEDVSESTMESTSQSTSERTESSTGTLGKFRKILKDIGKSIVDSLEQQRLEIENAYYEGMGMSDWMLVREFKNSVFPKRKGYEKALAERGFLEKDKNGQYIPTRKFYNYN